MLHLAIVFAEMERAWPVKRLWWSWRRSRLPATDGFAGRELGEPQSDTCGEAGVIERRRIRVDDGLADYIREEPGLPVVR